MADPLEAGSAGEERTEAGRMNDLLDGEVYHEEEWPHGLRCAECSRLFTEGERYSARLTGFQDDIPMTLIVCVGCAVSVDDS